MDSRYDTLMEDVKRMMELEKISMKKSDNPKTLFSQITAIEYKFRGRTTTALTDAEKLAIIIRKAPKMYAGIICNVSDSYPGGRENVKRMMELEKISMKKSDNPKTLFSQIMAIEYKFRGRTTTELTDAEKLAIIIRKAPKMYAGIICYFRASYPGGGEPQQPLKALRKIMYSLYTIRNMSEHSE